MKRAAIIILSIVSLISIVVCVSIFYFVYKDFTHKKFLLIRESDNVFYKLENSSGYTKLTSNEIELKEGSFVKTEENGLAQIVLPDNSIISLDKNTEIQVQIKSNELNIEQFLGRTWHRVKSLGAGESYEVSTPETIASVRGTIFEVNVEEDESFFYVEESEIQVTEVNDSDNSLELSTNDFASFQNRGSVLERLDLPRNFREDPWYLKNRELDSYFRKDIDKNDLKEIIKDKVRERRQVNDMARVPTSNDMLNQLYASMASLSEAICENLHESEINLDEYQNYSIFGFDENTMEATTEVLSQFEIACEDNKITEEEIRDIYSNYMQNEYQPQ